MLMLIQNSEVRITVKGKHRISLYGCYAIAKSADASATGDMLGTPVTSCQCGNIVNFLPTFFLGGAHRIYKQLKNCN